MEMRSPKATNGLRTWRFTFVLLAPLAAAGCDRHEEQAAAPPRFVRTVTVDKTEAGAPITLTGRVEAKDDVNLAFRISGRMIENNVRQGDRVEAGQVIARLDPQNEQNALRAAEASYAAATAALTQARNHFDRQDTLLAQGWTTRANHDQARKGLDTAQAQVDAAEAQLKIAHDLLSFTVLEADAPGVVTAQGPRAGTVVQAGQTIAAIARKDGRDAVFDVPAQILRTASPDTEITVHLTSDPNVVAHGRVREVAAQADPVTRTFEVRVGLSDPPPAMMLGATVTGQMTVESGPVVDIPASALARVNQQPAVWVVDPATLTVSPRNIEVMRFDPDSIAVSSGLDRGEVVVTAGVQALYPGQKVRLLGAL
jgi:RND family efflux transporter MFP subunit